MIYLCLAWVWERQRSCATTLQRALHCSLTPLNLKDSQLHWLALVPLGMPFLLVGDEIQGAGVLWEDCINGCVTPPQCTASMVSRL